ncbi:MAG TPA: ABC transporter permease subunit [Planctomycetota bacterium]|nr:ABC transporter permease subunit [Planctomycetota bacterium]
MTLGGITIIGSILAILFVIVMEMLPLFGSASVTSLPVTALTVDSSPLVAGSDELQQVAWIGTAKGVTFHSLADGSALAPAPDLNLGAATITAVTPLIQGSLAFGLSNGTVVPATLGFDQTFVDGHPKMTPRLKAAAPLVVDATGAALPLLARAAAESGTMYVSLSGPKSLTLLRLKQKKTLMGAGKITELRSTIPLSIDSTVTALIMDNRGEDLFVGLSNGQLVRVDLRDPEAPKPTNPVLAASKSGSAITALGFLNGDRTLVVGDSGGEVSSWQTLRSEEGTYYVTRMATFEPHAAPISRFSPSLRNKGFISADSKGGIHLNYSTTGSTLATLATGGDPVTATSLTPKANGIMAVGPSGKVYRWNVHNPHPETTLQSLFGQVWYEGYSKPEAVWQTTGGDDFEPKFGLVPLIYGTLKGTFYALIVAVPLALLSALYVSQFMHPSLKQNIKPLIEVMAALPSVVLGFIAALWLAPNIERRIPGIFLLPIVETIIILLTVAGWRAIPLGFRQRFRHGTEVVLIVPVVILGAMLSFWLGGVVESVVLGGDYQAWFLRVLGLSYDQRNSVVVGLAMGFAVIPIIFTIAEDSLSNVPPYLAAGSLALGATRWQTALKVVLPSASPGIFSAVMIGFGRAVGETMIVLMATGNTPVMNLNPFKGFRALSANVAVELPEAPQGETLFRVLFLAAFLLFLMTFLVNSFAELIRLRLRKKYQSL